MSDRKEALTSTTDTDRCAVVGICHQRLGEGIRDLVAASFSPVVVVSGEGELVAAAERWHARLVVIDLAIGAGDALGLIRRLRDRLVDVVLVVLTVDESPEVERVVLAAGADRQLLASRAADELLPAAEGLVAAHDARGAG